MLLQQGFRSDLSVVLSLKFFKSKLKSVSPGFLVKFFSTGHERSIQAKRNIAASFFIKGFSIVISLALVPATMHYVSPTNYGIWLTLSSIISWASFFDLGLGNGLRNMLTEAITKGDQELARTYVSTTYVFLSMIIAVVFVIFIVINNWLDWSRILNAVPAMTAELSLLAIIIFSFFGIQFVLQLITTVLTSDQQPAKAGFLLMISNFISLLIILILLKFTRGNLILLGMVMGGAPSLVFLVSSIWLYRKKYAVYKPSFKYADFSYFHDLISLGMKFFVIQAMVIIIFTTSNIVISQLFGPDDVTRYNIAQRYFSISISVFILVITPFWSAFTEAYLKNEMAWIKRSLKGLVKIWALFSIITILMIVAADFAYRIWVGPGIKISFGITILMGIYAILFNWANMFLYFLNGIGKIRIQLIFSVLMGIIAVPLMIFLGKLIGVKGVIMGSCLLVLVNSIWAPVQCYRILKGTATGLWQK